MRPILATALAATFCAASTPAQTYSTAPAGYLNKCGDCGIVNYATWFTRGVRAQDGDPTMKGSAATLLGVAWRPLNNAFSYSSSSGMGRRFSNLGLRLGHADSTKMTSVFSTNFKGASTLVYSGSLTLPTLSGLQQCSWGNAGKITFSAPFAYNGKDDLLQDYTNDGATLSNGNTSGHQHAYVFDACRGQAPGWSFLALNPGIANGSIYVPRIPLNGTRCADSGAPSSADAYTRAGASIYNDNYPVTSLRCKLRPFMYTYHTARGKPVIAVFTVGGSQAGIDVGTKCNRLHANMGFPAFISLQTAGTSGDAYTSHIPFAYNTYSNKAAGIEIYAQAAWNDSGNGRLALTIANKLILVRKGQSFGCDPGRQVYRYRDTSGSSAKWVPSNTDASYGLVTSLSCNRVDRYSLK